MANPSGWKPSMDSGQAAPGRGRPRGPRAASQQPLIFEPARAGRSGVSLPARRPGRRPDDALRRRCAARDRRDARARELDVVRHYTRLSAWNTAIDTDFYPLGSCTMKYNPKSNEALAACRASRALHPLPARALPGRARAHVRAGAGALPRSPASTPVTLQPAAGAQGELAGIMMIRAYHQARGERRARRCSSPTPPTGPTRPRRRWPAYAVVQLKSERRRRLDRRTCAPRCDEDVAAIMITNPNTLGLFETQIAEIAEIVHARGGLVYMRRRQHERAARRGAPGRHGLRRHALQPAQDLHHPARRRRARLGAGRA